MDTIEIKQLSKCIAIICQIQEVKEIDSNTKALLKKAKEILKEIVMENKDG